MRRVEYGEGDRRLVFVLGWGNRPEHDTVDWLLTELVDAGYQLTVFELPWTITDFESEYLQPVREFVDTLDSYRLLSHSTGGLIARYIEADDRLETRTYLSPWWGIHEDTRGPLLSLVTKLPISRRFLPAIGDDPESELGGLVTQEKLNDSPDRAAPTFLREAMRAQEAMPPFDESDVVFYTPTDAIVDAGAIERQTPEANRIQYEGGHELFASRCREEYLDRVLAAVDGGLDALPN
jgi:alpha-beta hydrolase superfamily lysophospholipase